MKLHILGPHPRDLMQGSWVESGNLHSQECEDPVAEGRGMVAAELVAPGKADFREKAKIALRKVRVMRTPKETGIPI